jgi:hypothetical protein
MFRAYYEGTEETAAAEESQREEHLGDAAS